MRKALSRRRAVPATEEPPTTVEWDREPGFKLGAILTTCHLRPSKRLVIFHQVRESSVAHHLGMREGMQLLSIGGEELHDAAGAHELLGHLKEGTLQLQYAPVPAKPRLKRAESAPAALPPPTVVAAADVPAEGIGVDVVNMVDGNPEHSDHHLINRNGILVLTRLKAPTVAAAPVKEVASVPFVPAARTVDATAIAAPEAEPILRFSQMLTFRVWP